MLNIEEVLSRILMMQMILSKLPDKRTISDFICRGIEDFPGIARVYFIEENAIPPIIKIRETIREYPVTMNNEHYGFFILHISSIDDFSTIEVYIKNICYMAAVVLEERRQRQLLERHREKLEETVQVRTTQLKQEIEKKNLIETELRKAKARSDLYLRIAEAIILELDTEGSIVNLNEMGCKLLEYSTKEIKNKNWFDLAIPESDRRDIKNIFHEMINKNIGNIEYYENVVQTKTGRLLHLSWHNTLLRDHKGNIIGTLSSGRDITGLKNYAGEIESALNEKEVLLRELYHRTKNNMQIINGILSLQASRHENPEFQELAREISGRIISMSLVHEKLYESGSLSEINLKEYLSELLDLLLSSMAEDSDKFKISMEMESVFIRLELAVPFGLVFNELVTNILKYAYPGHSGGSINISLHKSLDNMLEMTVSDSGKGFPNGFIPENAKSIGMILIFSLIQKQLKGSVRFESINGVTCSINIPLT